MVDRKLSVKVHCYSSLVLTALLGFFLLTLIFCSVEVCRDVSLL